MDYRDAKQKVVFADARIMRDMARDYILNKYGVIVDIVDIGIRPNGPDYAASLHVYTRVSQDVVESLDALFADDSNITVSALRFEDM